MPIQARQGPHAVPPHRRRAAVSRAETGGARRAARASARSAWASTTSRSSASCACSARTASHAPPRARTARATAPMTVRVVPRPGAFVASGPRPSDVYVADPSGIVFQLHDPAYCGGAGPTGADCRAVEARTAERPARGARDEPLHDRRRRSGQDRRLLPVAVRGAHPGPAGRRARLRHRPRRALPDVHRRRARTRRRRPRAPRASITRAWR